MKPYKPCPECEGTYRSYINDNYYIDCYGVIWFACPFRFFIRIRSAFNNN